ncbi:MAG TPA: glycosyltransferase [Candidatus Paceibacterota bacterium]|nr:glycosyltransferase [Candidatus Paceibacterota bacterium]
MKISVVTPVYNMERYIRETIESVLAQRGDFDVEYTLVNDGSADSSEKIIIDIKEKLAKGEIKASCRSFELRYIHQQNQGMYAAINNGFAQATGDIFAWIGGDDLYYPDSALQKIADWFANNPESMWAKGICGFIDDTGAELRKGVFKSYYQDWLAKGIYGRESYFVEQESTFWRASLWKKVAPIPTTLRSAGDYWLGIQFAKHAPLDSVREYTTRFRIRPGQISSQNAKYRAEQEVIMPTRSIAAYKVRLFSIATNKLRILSPLWYVMFKCMFPTKTPFVEIR